MRDIAHGGGYPSSQEQQRQRLAEQRICRYPKTTLVTDNTTLRRWKSTLIDLIKFRAPRPETNDRWCCCCRACFPTAFKIDDTGRLVSREWLYCCPKKSGKTAFEAIIMLTMVLLFGGGYPGAHPNDQEQARSRLLTVSCCFVHASPLLRYDAQVLALLAATR